MESKKKLSQYTLAFTVASILSVITENNLSYRPLNKVRRTEPPVITLFFPLLVVICRYFCLFFTAVKLKSFFSANLQGQRKTKIHYYAVFFISCRLLGDVSHIYHRSLLIFWSFSQNLSIFMPFFESRVHLKAFATILSFVRSILKDLLRFEVLRLFFDICRFSAFFRLYNFVVCSF